MLIEMLDKEIKAALADRLEAWELVEFLSVDVNDVLELLETEILDNLDEVLDFAGIDNTKENNDENDS